MRILLLLTLSLISAIAFSQNDDFKTLMANGKAEFNREDSLQDYLKAVEYFQKAVELAPRDAEARYFLGYAYSRLNSKDGQGMIKQRKDLTLKSSEQFEMVTKLSPLYKGELVAIDPYTKLSSEWGSLAMSYLYNNKQDSAIWAFKEGKKRGGFGNYILSVNRKILNTCKPNAILVSSGDIYTISLWYLQLVEGCRNDVSVVDISLLNSDWYPTYLSKNKIVSFDLPDATIDTINYCSWADSAITIKDFTWTVKPSYYEHYLLRGDRVFMSLLRKNNFNRDIYFTKGFIEEYKLSLQDYLNSLLIVDKLDVNNSKQDDYNNYKILMNEVLSLTSLINKNSPDEQNVLNNFRFDILYKIIANIDLHNNKQANNLLLILDRYISEKEFPYHDNQTAEYVANMREWLKYMED